MTNTKRNRKGQFAKGVSGNPGGRPVTEVSALRNHLAGHGEALAAKAVELALAGDTAALKLCLDRLSPPLKPRSAPVSVSVPSDAGLGDMARLFVQAASEGRISPDDAGQLLNALGSAARVIEVSELEQRIARLEAQHEP